MNSRAMFLIYGWLDTAIQEWFQKHGGVVTRISYEYEADIFCWSDDTSAPPRSVRVSVEIAGHWSPRALVEFLEKQKVWEQIGQPHAQLVLKRAGLFRHVVEQY